MGLPNYLYFQMQGSDRQRIPHIILKTRTKWWIGDYENGESALTGHIVTFVVSIVSVQSNYATSKEKFNDEKI